MCARAPAHLVSQAWCKDVPLHGDAAGGQVCPRAQEILRPAVRLKDAFSGECLCEYQLEEQAHEERERCSSVVMCRVFRQASGPRRGARPLAASCGGVRPHVGG